MKKRDKDVSWFFTPFTQALDITTLHSCQSVEFPSFLIIYTYTQQKKLIKVLFLYHESHWKRHQNPN